MARRDVRGAAEKDGERMNKKKVYPQWFLLLPLLLYIVFFLFPSLLGVFYSFTDWGRNTPKNGLHFVGLQNYVEIFTSNKNYASGILNTLKFTVVSNIVKIIPALFLAIILYEGLKGMGAYRTIFYMPSIIPFVIIGILFTSVLNYKNGMLNTVLQAVGLGALKQKWLSDLNVVWKSIYMVDAWRGLGYVMTIFMTGLSTIDKTYYAIVALENTNKGYTYSLSGQLQKHFDFGLDLMASYTFGHAYAVNDGKDMVVPGVSAKGPAVKYAPAKTLREIRLSTGLVFQNFNLFPHLTVLQNLCLAPVRVLGDERKDARAMGRFLLKRMGLEGKENAYPCELSGGQQQRVSIARALAMNPKILFFDEPTSALDPELTGEVLKIIKKLAEDKMTMVIVTHEMAFARDVADKVIFMDGGVIVEQGTPDHVFRKSGNERLAQFLSRFTNT